LANSSDGWHKIKASFAIESMILDDINAGTIGRMLACEMTLKEIYLYAFA